MPRVLSSWDEGKPGALANMQAERAAAAGTAVAPPDVVEEPAEEPAEEPVEEQAEDVAQEAAAEEEAEAEEE